MSSTIARDAITQLKTLGNSLPDGPHRKIVSTADQQREIELLRSTVHLEHFFFVMNVQKAQLEEVHGLERWLGYADKNFTLLHYFDIVHPAHAEAHFLTSLAVLETFLQGAWKIDFMTHLNSMVLALRHRNGHYLCFKQLTCMFQYNSRNQLLEYVSEFTLVGAYNGQHYSLTTLGGDGKNPEWIDQISRRMRSGFENRNIFSFQELRILRKYAYLPHLSSKEIAQTFKIESSTLATHKKRIQKKADNYFQNHFESVRQIAMALKEQGMI